ncbi:hemerythrin domain-containing protein [Saccharothrix syringae]|uniref:Hemerythrin domain-containing protein n=2 Tax=Saccharothrix syringae TaxID=103733 RepID=A0A5Q0HDS6_SACSY|nr:hemerythrin domain-containing protein [Saccharothrix syringae]
MAFGNQLVRVHVALREQLAELRDHLDDHLTGHLTGEHRPLPDLRAHCLSFCAAVTRHHTAEDDGAFPVLAREHPELRAVLEELARDHRVVSDALRALAERIGSPGGDEASARAARTEVDTVAALLETHFTYEERKIADALTGLAGRLGAVDAELVARAVEVPGR